MARGAESLGGAMARHRDQTAWFGERKATTFHGNGETPRGTTDGSVECEVASVADELRKETNVQRTESIDGKVEELFAWRRKAVACGTWTEVCWLGDGMLAIRSGGSWGL